MLKPIRNIDFFPVARDMDQLIGMNLDRYKTLHECADWARMDDAHGISQSLTKAYEKLKDPAFAGFKLPGLKKLPMKVWIWAFELESDPSAQVFVQLSALGTKIYGTPNCANHIDDEIFPELRRILLSGTASKQD